jgi:hypothetical protein
MAYQTALARIVHEARLIGRRADEPGSLGAV